MEDTGSAQAPSTSTGELDDGTYFTVDVDRTGGALHLIATGELDAASARQLASTLAREGRPGTALELDLAGVTFIDSSGLRVIAAEVRRYDESRTPFAITAASEPVRRIFAMTGLSNLLAPPA